MYDNNVLRLPHTKSAVFPKKWTQGLFARFFLALVVITGLSSTASAFTVSGNITVPDGSGIGNIQACAYQASPYVFKCAVSDTTGHYSITSVPAGTYRIDVQPWGIPTLPAPTSFSITGILPSTSVAADKTIDLALPFVKVTGHVYSQWMLYSLPGATVSTNNGSNTTWTASGTTYTVKGSATTAADGSFTMIVLAYNNYSVTAKTTDTNYRSSTQTNQNFMADSDIYCFLDFTKYLQGRINYAYYDGNPWTVGIMPNVDKIQLCAYSASPYYYGCTTTDTNGRFSLLGIPPGTYRIDVKTVGTPTTTAFPMADFSIIGLYPAQNIASNTYLAITLPHVLIQGHITGPTGAPLPGATMTLNRKQNLLWTDGATTYTNSGAVATADYAGNFNLLVLPGDYPMVLAPPPLSTSYYPRTYDSLSVRTFTPLDVKLTNAPNYQLTVKAPVGFVQSGILGASGDNIFCGSDGTQYLGTKCTASVDVGTPVTLTGDTNPTYCPGCVFNWTTPCVGTTANACTFTMPANNVKIDLLKMVAPVIVNILFEGGGGGAVNTISSLNYGLSCITGQSQPCSGAFKATDLPVTLVATPDVFSSVVGYTGDCTPNGTGGCVVSANLPDSSLVKNISVQMSLDSAPRAKIGQVGYATVQLAYDAAVDGDTILLLSGDHASSSLLANRPIKVSLAGGYNSAFTGIDGVTTLLGSISRLDGTVYMDLVYTKP